jgi:hypothetical protein
VPRKACKFFAPLNCETSPQASLNHPHQSPGGADVNASFIEGFEDDLIDRLRDVIRSRSDSEMFASPGQKILNKAVLRVIAGLLAGAFGLSVGAFVVPKLAHYVSGAEVPEKATVNEYTVTGPPHIGMIKIEPEQVENREYLHSQFHLLAAARANLNKIIPSDQRDVAGSEIETPAQKEEDLSGPPQHIYRKTTASILRMRTQPTLDSKVKTLLPNDTSVEVLQVHQDWVQIVTHEGHRGWVHAQYLSDVSD